MDNVIAQPIRALRNKWNDGMDKLTDTKVFSIASGRNRADINRDGNFMGTRKQITVVLCIRNRLFVDCS